MPPYLYNEVVRSPFLSPSKKGKKIVQKLSIVINLITKLESKIVILSFANPDLFCAICKFDQ